MDSLISECEQHQQGDIAQWLKHAHNTEVPEEVVVLCSQVIQDIPMETLTSLAKQATQEGFWETIGTLHYGLQAVLYSFITSGEELLTRMEASRVYLELLGVPGNINFFNSVLFRSVTQVIKSYAVQLKSNNSALPDIGPLLKSYGVVESLSLGGYPDLFMAFVSTVTEYTRICEPKHKAHVLTAFQLLEQAGNASPEDSDRSHMKELDKVLLSVLITNILGSRFSATTKEKTSIRESTFNFILESSSKTTRSFVKRNVLFLLQMLCINVPDRADGRNRLLCVVAAMLDSLDINSEEVPEFFQFIEKMSKNSKTGLRVFSLELIPTLLQFIGECGYGQAMDVDEVAENSPMSLSILLVHILVARVNDKASKVRGKALQSFTCLIGAADTFPSIRSTLLLLFSQTSQFEGLRNAIYERTQDETIAVRKVAIQTLSSIFDSGIFEMKYSDLDLEVFAKCTGDESLSIRKQGLVSLTQLMVTHMADACPPRSLQEVWVNCALPLVVDPETTVQKTAIEAVSSVILQVSTSTAAFVFSTCSLFDSELEKYFGKALERLHKDMLIPKSLFRVVNEFMESDRIPDLGLWVLAESLARIDHKPLDNNKLSVLWEEVKTLRDLSLISPQVSRLISVISIVSSQDSKSPIRQELIRFLQSFHLPTEILQACLVGLCEFSNEELNWFDDIVAECQTVLDPIIRHNAEYNEVELLGRVFVMGEGFARLQVKPYTRIVELVGTIVACEDGAYSVLVRAHAFLALGKFCILEEALAEKYLTSFLKELQTSDSPIIRNNVVLILCALCRSYTSLVEQHIATMALALADESAVVRFHTLTALDQLFQEDFIKWKGSLFLEIISCVVDDHDSIKNLAVSMIKSSFSAKAAAKNAACSLFSQYFVESLFFFNDVPSQSMFNNYPSSARFACKTDSHSDRTSRFGVYRMFLENMSDEQKFVAGASLCQDVLGGFVDGAIPLSLQTRELARDVLLLLSCPEIKIKTTKLSDYGDPEENNEERLLHAKSKVLSQMQKKNIIQNIIPVLIEMKRRLEEQNSSLVRLLMDYIKNVFTDFPEEFEEFSSTNRQIAKEIKFDMERHQKDSLRDAKSTEHRRLSLTPRTAKRGSFGLVVEGLNSPFSPNSCFASPKLRKPASVSKSTPSSKSTNPFGEEDVLSIHKKKGTKRRRSRISGGFNLDAINDASQH